MLTASGVSPQVSGARGYRTVQSGAELRRLGFGEAQRRVPCLLIPLYGVTGEVVGYQARPDSPRVGRDGKAVKYETPGKSRMVLDVPPGARAWLGDPRRPLFITEGVKKADSAVSRGLCCLALLGVWNWRGTNEFGGKTALVEWESIAVNGRDVYIVFDSDVMTKRAVHAALVRLKAFLESRKANVFVVYLPSGDGGAKVGLDDFFVAGHSVDEVLARASRDVRRPEGEEDAAPPDYLFKKDGIYQVAVTQQGREFVRLTNFVASIRYEITLDDGQEPRKVFRLVAAIEGREVEFDVPAGEFELMRWPAEEIGAGATLLPVPNVERHVRAAIQLSSGVAAPKRKVYTHMGWAVHGECHVFLHAKGAIGAEGEVKDVEVQVMEGLTKFALPPPVTKVILPPCLARVLKFLEIGPARILLSLFACAFRVVVGEVDFSVHVVGGTGVFKTAIAAILQQFFGRGLDARNLPGTWSSTANSLEALAFYAKDVVLVVDDFVASGGAVGLNRAHQTAERVFRSQGNRAGRGRCAPDGSLRPTRSPRGLIISTGEDTPRGASLRARFLTLEVAPGAIDRELLTEAQQVASSGDCAQVMSNFVQWMAQRLDATRARLPERLSALRQEFTKDGLHRRVPGIAADLLFGFEVFIEFAVEVGAFDAEEGKRLWKRAFDALGEAVGEQEREQEEAEPAARFMRLLRSAIASGEAHLCGSNGAAPANPGAWGWRLPMALVGVVVEGAERWQPGGKLVGWIEGENAYLDIEAALKAAQAVGNPTGDPISILPDTLSKRLKEAGHLASTDPDERHIEVQKRLNGVRRRVLHLSAESLMPTGDLP